jgi:hypothetical protein
MELAQDRVQWWALVLAVLNLRVLLEKLHSTVLDAAKWSVITNPRSLHFKFISICNSYQHSQNRSQPHATAK